jgi:hypothetical protein
MVDLFTLLSPPACCPALSEAVIRWVCVPLAHWPIGLLEAKTHGFDDLLLSQGISLHSVVVTNITLSSVHTLLNCVLCLVIARAVLKQ